MLEAVMSLGDFFLCHGTIIVSILAIVASILTMRVLYVNRRETNRPIVTARIESSCYDLITTLTLKLYNTGQTPALDITLDANIKDIEKSFASNAPEKLKKEVLRCLSKENIIPIIHNSSFVENGFGSLSNTNDSTFNLASKIPITIKYKSLYNHTYTQEQVLIITITDNFAGSGWSKKEDV